MYIAYRYEFHLYCSDCKADRITIDGYYTCPKCEVIADHAFVHEGQWIDNIWLKYEKKSVRSRNRWMYKKTNTLALFVMIL